MFVDNVGHVVEVDGEYAVDGQVWCNLLEMLLLDQLQLLQELGIANTLRQDGTAYLLFVLLEDDQFVRFDHVL